MSVRFSGTCRVEPPRRFWSVERLQVRRFINVRTNTRKTFHDRFILHRHVSKANLDTFFHPEGLHRSYPNTVPGRRRLVDDLSRMRISMVVFEASGGYERPLRQTLGGAGLPHSCVQPMRVHSFLKAQGCKAKTDRLDAKALALFAAAGMAKPTSAQDEDLLALRDMTRALALIRRQAATLKCQMEKLGSGYGQPPLQALLEGCGKQEKALLKIMKEFVLTHAALKESVDILASMPGIGFYTACIIASELPELGTCSKAEIAALTGTAPYTRQSRQWQGKASIKGGRRYARKALYMAALTACRFNPVFRAIYEKLRARGKSFKVAITAVMRKIAIAINSMIKNNRIWSEIYA